MLAYVARIVMCPWENDMSILKKINSFHTSFYFTFLWFAFSAVRGG